MTAGVSSWQRALTAAKGTFAAAAKGAFVAAAILTALPLTLLKRRQSHRSEIRAVNRHFAIALPEPDEYLLCARERTVFPDSGLSVLALDYASLTDPQLENIWQALPHGAVLGDLEQVVRGMKGEKAARIHAFLQDFSADAQLRKAYAESGALYFAFDPQTGKAVLLEYLA